MVVYLNAGLDKRTKRSDRPIGERNGSDDEQEEETRQRRKSRLHFLAMMTAVHICIVFDIEIVLIDTNPNCKLI